MNDLITRIRAAEPRAAADPAARERARLAAVGSLTAAPAPASRRRAARLTLALAGLAAAASLAVVVVLVLLARAGDATPRLVLPGDDDQSPPAHQGPLPASRPGIAGTIVFRPVAGVTADEAYTRMVAVIEARARAQRGVTATAERVERDRALVTLTGTRERMTFEDVVAGSAIAVYDLDDVLVGSFSSFHRAVLRARELAPGAPATVAYMFRNGRLVRGPAPTAADLRRLTRTLPPGSEILGLPKGYAILRRQYVRDAAGQAQRLRSAQFFLVEDRPALTPLQVVGTTTGRARPAGPAITAPIELTTAGRRAWDELLARVSARAAAAGRPQRVALTTNGDIWQVTTADASGRLDTRPSSPALEFGSFTGGSSGGGLIVPTRTDVPQGGSIPALVWVDGTYRVGPPPEVLGERVQPLPAQVRRAISLGSGSEGGDLPTVRRALRAAGPDGEWSVWNYLLTSGAARALVVGPNPPDGFGLGCPRTRGIQDCGGSTGFQLFAVPTATRTLRFTPPGGASRVVAADNGWAIVLGPRRSPRAPRPGVSMTAVAKDAAGRILARSTERYSLP